MMERKRNGEKKREEIIALRLYITSTSTDTDTAQVDHHHHRMYTKRRQKMDNFFCVSLLFDILLCHLQFWIQTMISIYLFI